MIRALIIDDEEDCIEGLQNLLVNGHENIVEVVGRAKTVRDGIEAIALLRPDLVFLDVQIGQKTGFDLLSELDRTPEVIFTTAYDEYALRAFEVNALDYLLKPIEPKRLADALHKLEEDDKETTVDGEPVSVNRSMLSENDQVFVKDGERCWFVKLSDIRLFESVGNYAKVYFGPNKPLILKSLNALEERLDEKMFFRANRKHIVNLRMIEKVEPYFNGGLLLEIHGGDKIEVSRRQAVKFKEMMSL